MEAKIELNRFDVRRYQLMFLNKSEYIVSMYC